MASFVNLLRLWGDNRGRQEANEKQAQMLREKDWGGAPGVPFGSKSIVVSFVGVSFRTTAHHFGASHIASVVQDKKRCRPTGLAPVSGGGGAAQGPIVALFLVGRASLPAIGNHRHGGPRHYSFTAPPPEGRACDGALAMKTHPQIQTFKSETSRIVSNAAIDVAANNAAGSSLAAAALA